MAVRGRDGGLEGWREGDFTKCDLHAPRRAAYREGGRPRRRTDGLPGRCNAMFMQERAMHKS